jgi:uncharacterized hydrophobic protein (TIGR00341 family)
VRLVQVSVPAGKREAVLDVLDEEGIDYVVSEETSGREYTAVVWFPLPAAAVEPVLESLREAGVERTAYTVVVDAETVISRRFEELTERYEEDGDGDRIAREELVARASDLAPARSTFLVMTVLSAVVATAGLLLDSPAVVVGSMVIAPLVGPAMAAAVGTVVDDAEMYGKGFRQQLAGGVVAVLAAAAFAFVLRATNVVPLTPEEVFVVAEIRERLAPDFLSLAVALAAGVAGALSLSSGVSTALVGVMIAAALVPPTAVVGIGVAWGRPTAVLGSAVLVVVNFVSINFAALAVLWVQNYRPTHLFRADEARAATVKRIAVLGGAILVLSAFLGGVTFASYHAATFETQARQTAADTLDPPAELLSLDVSYDGFPVRQPTEVTVTVGHPPGTPPPLVADRLDERINRLEAAPFGLSTRRVGVEVRYVVVERS